MFSLFRLTGILCAGGAVALSASAATFRSAVVTETNRRDPHAMAGNWGPHLRAPMVDGNRKTWMVLDGGNDVRVNRSLRYLSSEGGSWREEAALDLPATIQQNVATVLAGEYLYSYGVNVRENYLAECYFHTVRTSYRACNAVQVSGRVLRLPQDSNYVGAAVSPVGARLVWFTQMGAGGAAGKFFYLYNGGGGWNGPYQVTLGGYGVLAYVYASFRSSVDVVLGGELHVGPYPGGKLAAGIVQFRLGETPAIQTPFRIGQISGDTVESVEDVWRNPEDDGIHVLARTSGGALAYFHKGWTEPWRDRGDPLWIAPHAYRGRFVPAPDGTVLGVLGRNREADDALTVRHFAGGLGRPPRGALRWDLAAPSVVDLGGAGFRYPGAIYAASTSYQDTPLRAPRFAVCGEPWENDHKIVSFTVRGNRDAGPER